MIWDNWGSQNKLAQKKSHYTIPFTIARNNSKCLGVDLPKQEKDLYDKNFRSLKKEMQKLSEDRKILNQ